MDNEVDKTDLNTQAAVEIDPVVMCDVKDKMLALVKRAPIKNVGSFAMVLLWQIFEVASDDFEEWEKLGEYSDEQIEAAFYALFPVFIANYPKTTMLDT